MLRLAGRTIGEERHARRVGGEDDEGTVQVERCQEEEAVAGLATGDPLGEGIHADGAAAAAPDARPPGFGLDPLVIIAPDVVRR